MNATHPSSARSPGRWAATIGPSVGRRLLVALLALGAVRALALCELPPAAFVALAFGVLCIALRDALGAGAGGTLRLDGDGVWHVTGFGRAPFTGRLAQAGYRGAALVVLVIVGERRGARFCTFGDPRRHVAVYADAADPTDFSFLHLQLACAAEAQR